MEEEEGDRKRRKKNRGLLRCLLQGGPGCLTRAVPERDKQRAD